MRFRQMPCDVEIHAGGGAGGVLMLGDVSEKREALMARFGGQAQTVYLDPPFNTGKKFVLRQRCGEAGWASGSPTIELPAYEDRWPDEGRLLSMLREAIELSHRLLRDDGSLFLHIDARLHAPLRLMLDEVFGPRSFVNEIIWVYQTGGRSTAHFSRKHDIILFYRKSPAAYFDIRAVGVPRSRVRSNHMRRSVDEHGRAYRSIVSQGKEYRYYDDAPAYPAMCGTTFPICSRRTRNGPDTTRKSRFRSWKGSSSALPGRGTWSATCSRGRARRGWPRRSTGGGSF